jgi:hypothetical protein
LVDDPTLDDELDLDDASDAADVDFADEDMVPFAEDELGDDEGDLPAFIPQRRRGYRGSDSGDWN